MLNFDRLKKIILKAQDYWKGTGIKKKQRSETSFTFEQFIIAFHV